MVGVVRLPKVPASKGVRAVSPMTMRTLSNGTRSSSATVCASEVRMFWPISTLPQNAVTVPSSPMCSQALMSEGKSCGWKPWEGAVSWAAREFVATAKTAMPVPSSLKNSRRARSKWWSEPEENS